MGLKAGDKAPLFEGSTDDGKRFILSDLVGKTNVILYFYPKDFTMGCTKEACSFRDNFGGLEVLGATVVGVSSDSVETHRRFKKEHGIPFLLISDEDRSIRKMYGANGLLLPSRITFVIDEGGIIRHVFSSQLNVTKHVEEALLALQNNLGEDTNISGRFLETISANKDLDSTGLAVKKIIRRRSAVKLDLFINEHV